MPATEVAKTRSIVSNGLSQPGAAARVRDLKALAGKYVVSFAAYRANFDDLTDLLIMVKADPGQAEKVRGDITAVIPVRLRRGLLLLGHGAVLPSTGIAMICPVGSWWTTSASPIN